MNQTAQQAGTHMDSAELRVTFGECSLGTMLMAHSHHGLCAILLGDDAQQLLHELRHQFPMATPRVDAITAQDLAVRVKRLMEKPGTGLDWPLDIQGTAFQCRVWEVLRSIPAGQTATYTEVAKRLGNPQAARAVARACAANPLAVAIPCHRVLRQDGDLSGYRWGVDRKRLLLQREQAA